MFKQFRPTHPSGGASYPALPRRRASIRSTQTPLNGLLAPYLHELNYLLTLVMRIYTTPPSGNTRFSWG